jgi:hypothetical protein
MPNRINLLSLIAASIVFALPAQAKQYRPETFIGIWRVSTGECLEKLQIANSYVKNTFVRAYKVVIIQRESKSGTNGLQLEGAISQKFSLGNYAHSQGTASDGLGLQAQSGQASGTQISSSKVEFGFAAFIPFYSGSLSYLRIVNRKGDLEVRTSIPYDDVDERTCLLERDGDQSLEAIAQVVKELGIDKDRWQDSASFGFFLQNQLQSPSLTEEQKQSIERALAILRPEAK